MNERAAETVINLPVPSVALWAALAVTVAVFMTVTAAVHHHWGYYGLKGSDQSGTVAVYYVTSGILLAGMVVSAIVYGAL